MLSIILMKSEPGPLIFFFFLLASTANSINPSPGTQAIKAELPADIPLPALVVLAAACFVLWFLPGVEGAVCGREKPGWVVVGGSGA